MTRARYLLLILTGAMLTLSACANSFDSLGSLTGSLGSVGSGPFSGGGTEVTAEGDVIDSKTVVQQVELANGETVLVEQRRKRRIFGGGRSIPGTDIQVNKYIWSAALDVLDFLPVKSADPFTGVIVTEYGTAPGSSRAWRATIYIQDPALDARSLNLSLYPRNGPASAETLRAVENAILTRARQLRSTDANL